LAQNIASLFPELVITNSDGYQQVNYSAMGIYAIEAIKELDLKVNTAILATGNTESTGFFDALKSWLGNVSNGLDKLFAREIRTDKLCVGETCLDENQIKQILQSQGMVIGSPSDNPDTSSGVGTDTADSTTDTSTSSGDETISDVIGDGSSGSAGTTSDTAGSGTTTDIPSGSTNDSSQLGSDASSEDTVTE